MTTRYEQLELEAEIYSTLCDFFERNVMQPETLPPIEWDVFRHTSKESRALALALEERLALEGYAIVPLKED